MKKKILILLLDPYSITETIILKSINFLKKKNYLLVGDINLFKKLKKKVYVINNLNHINKKKINFYNINKKYSSLNKYINIVTDISVDFLNKGLAKAIINMPLNKKNLDNGCLGYTEFFAKKIKQLGKETMLLYSNDLAVSPLTTHIPINDVDKFIKKSHVIKTINNINFFYKKIIKKKINIKICGLNPHASKDLTKKNNKDKKIIIPLLNNITKKKKYITGPYSADTIFYKLKNCVVIGMYHDQVLAPFKALKGFKAINITLGLKFLRISTDHGTGLDILKNKKQISNESFKYCIKFCDKYLNA